MPPYAPMSANCARRSHTVGVQSFATLFHVGDGVDLTPLCWRTALRKQSRNNIFLGFRQRWLRPSPNMCCTPFCLCFSPQISPARTTAFHCCQSSQMHCLGAVTTPMLLVSIILSCGSPILALLGGIWAHWVSTPCGCCRIRCFAGLRLLGVVLPLCVSWFDLVPPRTGSGLPVDKTVQVPDVLLAGVIVPIWLVRLPSAGCRCLAHERQHSVPRPGGACRLPQVWWLCSVPSRHSSAPRLIRCVDRFLVDCRCQLGNLPAVPTSHPRCVQLVPAAMVISCAAFFLPFHLVGFILRPVSVLTPVCVSCSWCGRARVALSPSSPLFGREARLPPSCALFG